MSAATMGDVLARNPFPTKSAVRDLVAAQDSRRIERKGAARRETGQHFTRLVDSSCSGASLRPKCTVIPRVIRRERGSCKHAMPRSSSANDAWQRRRERSRAASETSSPRANLGRHASARCRIRESRSARRRDRAGPPQAGRPRIDAKRSAANGERRTSEAPSRMARGSIRCEARSSASRGARPCDARCTRDSQAA